MKKLLKILVVGMAAFALLPSTLALGANARPVISDVVASPALTKQVTQTVSVKFKVSETSKVSLNIYKSGKLVKNGMNKVRKSKGLVTYNWTGTKSNGIYTIKIDATDLSGLKAVTKSLAVNIDSVKPVISSVVTDLSANAMANGDEAYFLVKLQESSTLNVRIYGGAYPKGYTIYNKYCPAGENELFWNGKFGSLVAKDGAYTVVFTAIDKALNLSVTKSIVITKDSVAPVIKTSGFAKAVFNPAQGSNTFSYTASEPVQFLVLISPKNTDPLLNPVFGAPELEPAFATTGSLVWDGKQNITEPYTQVPDGEYVYRLFVMDKAGNISSVDAPVKVDTTKPEITEANIAATFVPNGNNNNEMNFKINETGITKVVVVKETESATVVKTLFDGNKTAGTQTVQWDGKDNNNQIVTPGTYQVKITLTDAAGNQADVVTSNVEIKAASTISSTLGTSATTGEEKAFDVSTVANGDAEKIVKVKVTLNDANQKDNLNLQYLEADGQYYPLTFDNNGVAWFGPEAGFPLGDITSPLKITFNAAGIYGYKLEVVQVSDNAILATANESVTVADPYVPAAISSTLGSTATTALEKAFEVATVANSDANKTVRVKITLNNASQKDNLNLLYLESDGQYYPLAFDNDGVAWFGPEAGFPLGDISSPFKITFNAAGDYGYKLEVVQVSDNAVLSTANESVTVTDQQ